MGYEENVQSAGKSRYECLLFDLDDTLYPLGSGLAAEVKKNIQDYMREKLGIEEDEVPELCFSLYKQYGTTMAGLKAIGYAFHPDDFHSFVHGRLPYTMLKPDPTLRTLLLSIPIRKLIFTNADKAHAARVLSRLGLEDCFEGIICFETLNPVDKTEDHPKPSDVGTGRADTSDISNDNSVSNEGLDLPKTPFLCKPSEEAFKQVFRITNISPRKTLFFDDSIHNLQTAKRLGLHTVWVGTSRRTEGVDVALEHMHNIREALPELWEDEEEEPLRYRRKQSIETPVRA